MAASPFPDFPLSASAAEVLLRLRAEKEEEWMARGEARALRLFHEMSQRVPAYRSFLAEQDVKPESITTIADFGKVPLTNKENYLLRYPLEDLSWDGEFKGGRWIIASTSGSTGEPFYFPRTTYQDDQFLLTAEICLLDIFQIDRKSTLFIDCFALGVWIGGMFMYQAVKNIIDSDCYRLSIITPGADKSETIKAFKALAPHFDQVIIGGYGPLVKDLIDDGIRLGIDWNKHDVKYFFAAEGFTEGFRDYIVRHGGVKHVLSGTANHYGTADLGTMAHETPLSILIRRQAAGEEGLREELFGDAKKEPTLVQYIPELFYFEAPDNRLACSACGGLPLVRYDLKDRGGIIRLETMKDILRRRGIDVFAALRKEGIAEDPWQLPFAYLHERDDLTVSIYSVNIYPESVRRALQAPALEAALSGKFTMTVDYDKDQNQFLEINVEVKSGVAPDEALLERTRDAVVAGLYLENSEWRDFYADEGIRHKVTPTVVLWPYQDPLHFKPGGKQKWVKKNKPS